MHAEIAICNCVLCMDYLYAVGTELGEVCCLWFVLLKSASTELAKNILSADIRTGGVKAGFSYIPHLMRIFQPFDNTPYFCGTRQPDYRCSLGFLILRIIIVVMVVVIEALRLRIISGDDFICSHGCQDAYQVAFPFVIVGVSELREVAPLGFVVSGFGGSHHDVVEIVFSFSAIFAAVATVTRSRVLEALFEIVIEIVRFLDSSDSWAHNLLKSVLINLSRRDTKTKYVQTTICVWICSA